MPARAQTPATTARATIYEGARLITCDGSAPIEVSGLLSQPAVQRQCIGHPDEQAPAGLQQFAILLQQAGRVLDVFEHESHFNDVELRIRMEILEEALHDFHCRDRSRLPVVSLDHFP